MAFKSLTIFSLFVFSAVLIVPGSTLPGSAQCAAAKDFYTFHIESEDRVYNELTKADYRGICGLSETCCNEAVERNFSLFAVQDLRQKVREMWQEKQQETSCNSTNFKDSFAGFIEQTKQNLLEVIRHTYRSFFTQQTLFDRFFNYLKQAVYTGNTCEIGVEFNTLYFEVFLTVLEGHPAIDRSQYRLNDRDFSQCVYNYNLERKGETLRSSFLSLTRSFNRTLYYIRALDTAEEFVRLVSELQMTPQCQQAVMRTTFCAQCGGQSASVTPCRDMCLNAVRGCLVDYTDLHESYQKFTEAAILMKEYLNELVNPFTRIDQFAFSFLDEANTIIFNIQTIHQQILIRCVGDSFRRRRHADQPSKEVFPRAVQTRSTVPPPNEAFNTSAYCLRNLAPLFNSIPDTICSEVSPNQTNDSCWNGDRIGRYEREVVGFTREEQHNNPELIVCNVVPHHIRVQLSYLQRVTQEMNVLSKNQVCPEDDEDCSVDEQNMCNFRSYRPVHSNVTDQPSVDQDEIGTFSGSGCQPKKLAGSGDGSGSGEEMDDTEVEEDDTECTPTRPPECLAIIIEPTTTSTTATETSSSTSSKPSVSKTEPPVAMSSTKPVPTPTPEKEPPIIIQALPAGAASHIPSFLLLFTLLSLAVLQSVL